MINTRKGMNLVLLGVITLVILSMNVSASEEEPLIRTTSVENPEEPVITEVTEDLIKHDASAGERGDVEDLPMPKEDNLLIAPYTGDENLVTPDPGAEGDVFILDAGSEMESENQVKSTDAPFNFPAVLTVSCIGMMGLLYVASKRQK